MLEVAATRGRAAEFQEILINEAGIKEGKVAAL